MPNCVVAFVGCKWGWFYLRDGLDLSQVSSKGGGFHYKIGRHKRYIPLSGLSVLWHLVVDLRVACSPSMDIPVSVCARCGPVRASL